MSHLKNPPHSVYTSFAHLVLALALVSGSGCAMVQIPSYRLEECAAESYSSTPTLLPPLPVPGWLARWKAEKQLPKPAASPRFHPLPTRPMFLQQPTLNFAAGLAEPVCFGELPPAASWNAAESAALTHSQALPTPTLAEPL